MQKRDCRRALEYSVAGHRFHGRVKVTVFDVVIDKCPSAWMPKGGPEDNSMTTTATIRHSDLDAIIKVTQTNRF